jgi:hypothetical protein
MGTLRTNLPLDDLLKADAPWMSERRNLHKMELLHRFLQSRKRLPLIHLCSALFALACCVPALAQIVVDTGDLKIEPRYNGQTLDLLNMGYDLTVYVDGTQRGGLVFTNNGPAAPITSLTVGGLPTGTHSVYFESGAMGVVVPGHNVTISPGATSIDAFELSPVMGIINGTLLVNGAPPSDNSYGVGATTGSDYYFLNPGNSLFRILTLAGTRNGSVFKNPTEIIKLFAYTAVAGQETDLGQVGDPPPGGTNTPAGTNVAVQPTDPATGGTPVTLTFSSVSQTGTTTVVTSSSGPATPTGFALGTPAVYYNLATTATFTGPISICINYTGISFSTPPSLLHFEGNTWADVTTSQDTANHIVCGSVASLSPFGLFRKVDTTPPAITGMPAAGCTLWPPNGKFVQVADVKASDALSGLAPGSFVVTGTSNEPSNSGTSDIVITPDGSGGFTVQLRADRLGTGNGRVYTLTATAKDLAGNTATSKGTCLVPHDQGQ